MKYGRHSVGENWNLASDELGICSEGSFPCRPLIVLHLTLRTVLLTDLTLFLNYSLVIKID